MTKQNRIEDQTLLSGELYLFHPTDERCPADGSLYGIFSKREDGPILLESSSLDLCTFRLWQPLSGDYRYCRLASRAELRDYSFNLAYYEDRSIAEPLSPCSDAMPFQ